MATSSTTLLSPLIPATTPSINSPSKQFLLLQNRSLNRSKRVSLVVHAVKPPAGVKLLLLLLMSFSFLFALLVCSFFFFSHFADVVGDYEAIGHVCLLLSGGISESSAAISASFSWVH